MSTKEYGTDKKEIRKLIFLIFQLDLILAIDSTICYKKWGERNIDIDILYYNNDIINQKDLQIPHKHLHERKFILKPLNDIDPNYINPTIRKTNSKLLNECTDNSIVNDI